MMIFLDVPIDGSIIIIRIRIISCISKGFFYEWVYVYNRTRTNVCIRKISEKDSIFLDIG